MIGEITDTISESKKFVNLIYIFPFIAFFFQYYYDNNPINWIFFIVVCLCVTISIPLYHYLLNMAKLNQNKFVKDYANTSLMGYSKKMKIKYKKSIAITGIIVFIAYFWSFWIFYKLIEVESLYFTVLFYLQIFYTIFILLEAHFVKVLSIEMVKKKLLK